MRKETLVVLVGTFGVLALVWLAGTALAGALAQAPEPTQPRGDISASVAQSVLAINPFEMERTTELGDNLGLEFQHHWEGYTDIWNNTYTKGTIYIPVHNFTNLSGAALRLQSLRVCYEATSGSYISTTRVYYADDTRSRTEVLSNETDRSSTLWTCYTVISPSPAIIDGPMLVYFNIVFDGTGASNKVAIGQIKATLVPEYFSHLPLTMKNSGN